MLCACELQESNGTFAYRNDFSTDLRLYLYGCIVEDARPSKMTAFPRYSAKLLEWNKTDVILIALRLFPECCHTEASRSTERNCPQESATQNVQAWSKLHINRHLKVKCKVGQIDVPFAENLYSANSFYCYHKPDMNYITTRPEIHQLCFSLLKVRQKNRRWK
jgi:hypothetical protein